MEVDEEKVGEVIEETVVDATDDIVQRTCPLCGRICKNVTSRARHFYLCKRSHGRFAMIYYF
jgi:hypothetical protein